MVRDGLATFRTGWILQLETCDQCQAAPARYGGELLQATHAFDGEGCPCVLLLFPGLIPL